MKNKSNNMGILKLFRRLTIGCLLFTATMSAQAHINEQNIEMDDELRSL